MILAPIDYVIVAIYLIGILFLGIYLSRYIRSSSDYFLAGRMLPFWAIGMSIVVTDIGATDMVGLAGQAYRYGIAVANFDWLGSFPAMVIAAFVFIPYYWRAGIYTIPEYLGRRFNTTVRTTQSVIWILFIALDLGVIFYASGLLLQQLMGMDYWTAVIMTATIIGIYTYCGGLSAVVLTDVVQLVIMFVGAVAIIILGLWEVGGWNGLVNTIHGMGPEYSNHFNLLLPADTKTPYPWTGILFGLGFVMSIAYFVGNQTIVQRTLGAKSEWDAKASMLFGALFKALIPVLVITPGLIGLALLGGAVEDGDTVIPALIGKLLPPGMAGLMFVAFLAALMSSIDSLLNSVAVLWTKDIYEKFIRPQASDKELLYVGRIFILVLLVFAVRTSTLSQQFEGMYTFIQTLFSFFQGPTLAILLLGIFWKRCAPWGAFIGLVSGICSAGLMHYHKASLFTISDPFLFVSFWSFLVGFVVTIVASLFTAPRPDKELYGLVYGMVMEDEQAQQALKEQAHD
ncbi:sodium:solute symporter family transporter [Candidatus Uabimicrobium amorphum]|uniref:Sodium:solute symporter n=1 Tax=Uabimicrobium amorphum TaxID=2596890 RepID=A0A5S9F727_UABAM|nr:sodium/solute symporter [Candidatus Uabimicrobium amorphum]BBM87279.1 sodium:solute symporter [Candidatus Uabimicrobium amorphum]